MSSTEELIKALRICNNPKGHRCSECPVFSRYEHGKCKSTVDKLAADALSSADKELAELRERINAIDNIAVGFIEGGPYIDDAETLEAMQKIIKLSCLPEPPKGE